MPKKIIQKSFSKILFLIFIFSFIQIFIFQKKVEATFNASPALVRNCAGTTTSATLYVIDTSNLSGTLPLCLQDNDVGQTLTIRNEDGNSIYSTTSIGSNNNEGKIYYDYSTTIPNSDFSKGKATFNFLISDNAGGSQTTPSTFDLTLLPATIGMTVSTSTAGTSYSSGGTNISSSYSSSYYQLKYNQQINFSSDNTTKMAVYSSARNITSPFYKDLSASNNYSSNQILKNRCLYVFICFY